MHRLAIAAMALAMPRAVRTHDVTTDTLMRVIGPHVDPTVRVATSDLHLRDAPQSSVRGLLHPGALSPTQPVVRRLAARRTTGAVNGAGQVVSIERGDPDGEASPATVQLASAHASSKIVRDDHRVSSSLERSRTRQSRRRVQQLVFEWPRVANVRA